MFKHIQNNRYTQDGKAYNDGTGQYKWFNSNQNEAITVGEFLVFRLILNVPKNAIIQSAVFEAEYGLKNGNTVPQSFGYNAWMEFNAAEYPTTNDVYMGPVGTFPPLPRTSTKNVVSGTIAYSVNTPDDPDRLYINLQGCVKEIVRRADYVPGQSVSVIINPTSEVGDISLSMRDNAWANPHPNLDVQYIENLWGPVRHTVNFLENQTMEQDIENWHLSTAYGYYGDGMTIAHSTEQKRSGTRSLKVIGGDLEPTKNFGAFSLLEPSPNTTYVFAGWVYVPSSNPNPFSAQFQYITGSNSPMITTKNQWVPFCTPPTKIEAIQALYPAATSHGSSSSSLHFYLDDLMVIESKHEQMPFTGDTPNTRMTQYNWMQTNKRDASTMTARSNTYIEREPPRVLNPGTSTAGFSSPRATFSIVNNRVRASISSSSGSSEIPVTLTQTMTRKHRFVGVNLSTNQVAPWIPRLTSVTTAAGVITEGLSPSYVDDMVYYDIPVEAGSILSMTFTVTSRSNLATYFDVGLIAETDWDDLEDGIRPRSRWVKNRHGLWQRGEAERQSSYAERFVGFNDNMEDLENAGTSWDQLETATYY